MNSSFLHLSCGTPGDWLQGFSFVCCLEKLLWHNRYLLKYTTLPPAYADIGEVFPAEVPVGYIGVLPQVILPCCYLPPLLALRFSNVQIHAQDNPKLDDPSGNVQKSHFAQVSDNRIGLSNIAPGSCNPGSQICEASFLTL